MSANGFRRDAGTFRDKVDYMNSCFQTLSPCEQTIAIYSMLRWVSPSQAKFLSSVIDSITKHHDDYLKQTEAEANNPNSINGLHRTTEERALEDLLQLILLLRPGNEAAVKEYMNLLPKVLLGCSEEMAYLDKCRQLISIALVHPAFKQEQRNALDYWLQHLDDKWAKIMGRKGPRNKSHTLPKMQPQPGVRPIEVPLCGSMKDRGLPNSFSLEVRHKAKTPGETTSKKELTEPIEDDPREEEDEPSKPDRCVSDGYKRINGTDQPQRNTFEEPGSGMKQVPMWLKSLRLHKYQDLFQSMTYQEMMGITEEFLEQKEVTKGARNKIIQSLKTLSQRHETLCKMEQEIVSAKSVKGDTKNPAKANPLTYINELQQILTTPLPPYHAPAGNESEDNAPEEVKKQPEEKEKKDFNNGGFSSDEDSSSSGDQDQDDYGELLLKKDIPPDNLPMLIARVMYRVHELLYSEPNIENSIMAFIRIVDQALSHEAFQSEERNLLSEWKRECQSHLRVTSPRRGGRGRGYGSYTFGGMPSRGGPTGGTRKTNTVGRNQRIKGLNTHTGNRSSTMPRLGQRQLSIGPFGGGLPYVPLYGENAVITERAGSHNRLTSLENGGNLDNLFGSTSLTNIVGSSKISSPLFIKSKEQTSEEHMDDLCRRVAAHALEPVDKLDGMIVSLSGRDND